jgi:Protein of unknown function (DUF3108)
MRFYGKSMPGMKRRLFLISLGLLLFLFWQGSSAGEGTADPIGERFQGEVLRYDIGFWIFRRVGEGMATFRSLGNGMYEAFHEGKTLGFVGWISRHRRDVYRSTMGTINGGTRLIPYRFEEDVIIGQKVRKRITVYDYAARKVSIETQEGGTINREEAEIPSGILYDDPMTAFYNFRFGVYGKVEPGKEFFIHTAPQNGNPKTIRLTVAPKEEEERRRAAEIEKEGKDLFMKVHLDKELVGSLHGEVEVWFSQDIIPMSGVAKDVFFYGDIIGRLTYRGFSYPAEKINGQTDGEK